MTKWFLLGLTCLCIGLMACSKQPEGVSAKSSLQSCQAQCMKQNSACIKVCGNSCTQCAVQAHATADRHYAQFIHQQMVQGGLIARDLKSYRDPLQCLKTTCNCHADYYQCAQACTGTIHKRLQSPLTCC